MRAWRLWLGMFILLIGLPVLMGQGCGSPLSINEATEVDIGRQAAADLEAQYGVVNDLAATARVANIGRAIAAVSERPNLPWSFKILNVDSVNALALPGGFIYVTRGLLEQGLTNAELAGVIGHEIAHVNQRHSVDAIERAMTYDLLSDLVLGRSSRGVQVAADLAIQYAVQLPHSRQDEYEADDVGMRLAYNAGYPPSGLVQFLVRLQQLSGPSRSPEWMRTHPLTEDRVTRAQQLATSLQGQQRPVPVIYREVEDETAQPGAET